MTFHLIVGALCMMAAGTHMEREEWGWMSFFIALAVFNLQGLS